MCTKYLSKERFVCTKSLKTERYVHIMNTRLSKERRYVHKIDCTKRKILAQKYTVSKDRKCVHKYTQNWAAETSTTVTIWVFGASVANRQLVGNLCHRDESPAARRKRCLQLYRHTNNFWSECTNVFKFYWMISVLVKTLLWQSVASVTRDESSVECLDCQARGDACTDR